ncbi:MAG: hypothetical protein IKY42_07350 [Bacteroidaceae bacterium]|nr:hypothetical protein [Bacteroidaceae bacterium]
MGWLALLILEKGQCEGLTTGVSTEKQTPTSFLFPYILGLTAEFWGHRRHRFYFSLFMKKFLISLVMLLNLSVAGLFAQSSLIATLSHGDNISMYYGVNALVQALEAAVSGDVISLSGGTFNATNIRKAVSIRGAGIDESLPTCITGEFSLDLPENEMNKLQVEGVRCFNKFYLKNSKGRTVYFTKCHLQETEFKNTDISAIFTNCIINSVIDYNSTNGLCKVQFHNCVVFNVSLRRYMYSWVNCILNIYPGQSYWDLNFNNSQLLNCVIYSQLPYQKHNLSSSCIATNCVAVNLRDDFFNSQTSNSGNYHSSFEKLFKDFTGENTKNQKFELTDEAKAKFLGTDSTEVGWYGGAFPYTSIPSYPRITKMNVANKSTADGKLSVEIEVSAAK